MLLCYLAECQFSANGISVPSTYNNTINAAIGTTINSTVSPT